MHQTVPSPGVPRKTNTKNLACEVSPCNDATLLSVGDLVVVLNHGTKWTHPARIVSINESTSSAVVKWNSNGKKDLVDLADCMKYDLQCVSERNANLLISIKIFQLRFRDQMHH